MSTQLKSLKRITWKKKQFQELDFGSYKTTSNNLLSTTRNLIRTLKQKLHQKYVNATQKSKENYSHDKLGCIPFCRQISEDVKGKSSKDCWTQSKENQFQEFYLDTYLDT